MKKFTLLALASLVAGTSMGFADDVVTLPGGLIPSTKENPVYYKISNMRADRFNYVTGEIMDATHNDVIFTDTQGNWGPGLPEYLPDENETPMIWENPYMGLAIADGKFWTAFSAQKEVMDAETIYWWFEQASSGGNAVYVRNAVIDGALKNRAENVLGRPSMSFSETAKQAYYVLPLDEEQIEELELSDDPYGTDAFALSKNRTLVSSSGEVVEGQCLDMNNYITFNWTSDLQKTDENGEPMFTDGDEIDPATGEPVQVPVYVQYGFAGVNLKWNPLSTGNNDNYKYNNGSLFKVTRVEDNSIVEAAIKAYEEKKAQVYQEGVLKTLESAKASAIAQIDGLRNLPAIYSNTTEIDAIVADINNLNMDVTSVRSQDDVDVMEARIEADLAGQVNRVVRLAGDKTVIRLKQMLAIRDWEDYSMMGPDNSENLGNAYLSSNGQGQVKYEGSMEEAFYPAVTCLLTADATCDWTLEWVAGQGYRLKNGEKYIRTYGDWENVADWASIFDIDVENLEEGQSVLDGMDIFTWATTTNVEEAAVFNFSGCAEEVQNVTLNDQEQLTVDDYCEDLEYEDEEAVRTTTNICHLTAPDADGNTSWLCRDTAAQNYTVISWNAGDRYFANPNAWKIELISEGEEIPDGIQEISGVSAKAQGIYDLQGRKVANPSKGLYIINGVKTLVK